MPISTDILIVAYMLPMSICRVSSCFSRGYVILISWYDVLVLSNWNSVVCCGTRTKEISGSCWEWIQMNHQGPFIYLDLLQMNPIYKFCITQLAPTLYHVRLLLMLTSNHFFHWLFCNVFLYHSILISYTKFKGGSTHVYFGFSLLFYSIWGPDIHSRFDVPSFLCCRG